MAQKQAAKGPQKALGHAFGVWIARLAWLCWCKRCGLVVAKNWRTQAAMKAGCSADDPD